MKVYILTDLEGVSCVVREEQTTPSSREYDDACLLLTKEINAAVEGALEGGAAEIVVNDLHGARAGFNLILEELHRGAKYITGGPRPCRLAGLDKSFDVAFMVGYHAMAGTQNAVLEHTMSTRVIVNAYINGRRVGEIGIDASMLGYFGVPVALVTGCKKAVVEAQSLLGGVEGVIVKEGLSRNFAICLPPAETRDLIRKAAKKAVQRAADLEPFTVETPVIVKIEYSHPNYADLKTRTPDVERIDARTVRCQGEDLLEVMRRVGWY